jgi:hypothetical protein
MNDQRPVRFSIRELFILTALVALAGGFYSWRRAAFELSLIFFPLTVVGAIGFATYVLSRSISAVIWAVMGALLFACVLHNPLDHGPQPARRMQCSNHLKQIGLALQNYFDAYQSLPPAYIADRTGKPMHSWRVLILPYMERADLYKRYCFDEPWNGPNNSKLHNEIVEIFCCPSRPKEQPKTDTSYVAVMGEQTAWPDDKSIGLAAMTDGTSNTIMVVEVANSGIHWMEPRDLHILQIPMEINPPRGHGISSTHPNAALAVFADGHTAALTIKTPPEIIRRLLTIADGEPIGDY